MNLIIVLFGKLILIIAGVFYWKYLQKSYKIIFGLTLFAILAECVGFYLGAVKHQNNIWLFSLYNLIDFCIVSYVAQFFIENKIAKLILVANIFVGISIWFLNIAQAGYLTMLTWFSLYHYGTLLIIYLLILLMNVIFKFNQLLQQPVFWLCLSFILFYGVGLPVWALLNYMNTHDIATSKNLYYVIKILNLIRYPIIAYSFYLQRNQNGILMLSKN